ncbi:MAG TPA: NUDIX domain-containing protein [Nocardioidaceae bacterium]
MPDVPDISGEPGLPRRPVGAEPTPEGLRIRPAARAVVMDTDSRVLLVHFNFGPDDLPTGLWACPGGGIDPGESVEQGLVRELREEIGIDIGDPGPVVWWKEHVFPMTRWDGQQDTYFWIRVPPFEPRPAFTEAELRAEKVDGMRWWTFAEILHAQRLYDEDRVDDPAYTTFSPRRLGHLLEDLLREGHPPEPIVLPPL